MKLKNIDYPLFFIVLGLIIFGMIMISSVSVYPSFKVTTLMMNTGKINEPNNYFYLIRNISHIIISMIIFAFIIKTSYKFFEKYAKIILLVVVLFLIIVLFIGVTYNGARGWINLPFLPFSLQPAEFLKLAIILYLAYFLKRRKFEIADLKNGFFPFIFLLFLIVFLLILQPDFGTILIITPISVLMYFIAGGSIKHIGILFLVFLIFTFGIYFIGKFNGSSGERNVLTYVSDRFDNFLSTNKTAIQNKTINFQTEQGLIAIGSGGFFGLGFGKSIQKFGYLPEVQGDFIFSVMAEELGFFGVFILICLYLFIMYKGFYIALNVSDLFGKYTAFGITTWILVQTFINIGVNLNIVPLTGVTLPFISYGGSSLLSLMIGVAILLNISRDVNYSEVPTSVSRYFRKKNIIKHFFKEKA
ncbi:FtsW/RodA/SpoVE family cell cycle protein [Candidatus Gracilibacteria bacterium]|nr:FtsW/RodA/SpoVE family cell cycle protein [Candidatus Gracilibacteria bacterium]